MSLADFDFSHQPLSTPPFILSDYYKHRRYRCLLTLGFPFNFICIFHIPNCFLIVDRYSQQKLSLMLVSISGKFRKCDVIARTDGFFSIHDYKI